MNEQDLILDIDDLTVGYRQGERWQRAVRHVSLQIPAGQTCGLVGESGSGKTTLGLAVMRYLPTEGTVCEGTIRFAGRDLLAMSQAEMRRIWGAQIALMPQDPLASLNPSIRLGEQVVEILQHHEGLTHPAAEKRVHELFDLVRLADPKRVAQSYAHQLSGGMLQRVLIAMALSTEPRLLIMDEPTTSLDVTTQAVVLDLLRDLITDRQASVLYITHNLGGGGKIENRVVVLYAGEVVEDAATRDLFRRPLHPYTQGLLDCVPRLGQSKQEVELRPIEGRIPALDDLPEGCIFRPRCPLAIDICREYPPLYDAGEDARRARCHRWDELAADEISAHRAPPDVPERPPTEETPEPVLTLDNVKVHFTENPSLLEILVGERPTRVRAVNGLTLTIPRGKTLGLVGESGSGKTSLARAIVGLDKRTGGRAALLDIPLTPELSKRGRKVQQRLQIVFQSPDEALNPYLSIKETLRRPLHRLLGLPASKAEGRVDQLLRSVHLSEAYAERLPGQLSGGEKQRIAVARAFAPNPELLIADEPVTSLDVSVQASILNLLRELQAEHGISILFISHDLAVVGYLADDVAVIYLGQLMETAPVDVIFDPPYHPYTEALLSAVPLIDPEGEQEQIRLKGEVPSPSEKISGCPFHTRCPRFLGEICVEETPPRRVEEGTEKRIFCHIPLDELRSKQKRPFRFREESE